MKSSKLMAAAFAAVLFFGGLQQAKADDNKVHSIKINELSYKVPEKKVTAGKVIGTILDIASGKVSTKHEEKVSAVNAAVLTAFSNVSRLVPVAGDDFDYELTGEVTNITAQTKTKTVERKDSNGKIIKDIVTEYQATVSIALTITDMATGAQQTKSFSSENYAGNYGSESAAIDYAIKNISYRVAEYFNNMFPLTANIIERGKEKKDKMQQVYIDLGTQHGICEGMHFEVYLINYVAGRTVRKELGGLKVVEVLGDDISLCKVQRNAKGIKEAVDNDAELLIISAD